jgi:amino acid adenylation domain-containing protein
MELSPAKKALLEKWLQGKAKTISATISKRPEDAAVPLSFPQQRQLFLEMLERGTAVNNLSVLIELKGKLSPDALEQSANQILQRHETLRTEFSFGAGLPEPKILTELKISLPVIKLKENAPSEQKSEARRLAEKEVLKPFDLTKAPLIRLQLYSLSDECHLLLIVVHHTIADGWSLGVFLRELLSFYQANTAGSSPQLPGLAIQYADYAHWQNQHYQGETLEASMKYWKEKLAGELPALALPTDRPREARQSFSGGTWRFSLSRELTEGLEDLGRKEGATLFMTLLTAFYVLLHRYSGQEDILIGTPVANRTLPELESLIGVFINTLVLRHQLSGDSGFRELLRQVREMALEAFAHQDMPFERLVEELKPKRDLSRTPLFQVVFNMQNSPMPRLAIPGLEAGFREIDRGVSQFDLSLMITRSEGEYKAEVEYNSKLFQAGTITRMFQSYQLLLENIVAQPERPIARLPIATKEELQYLTHDLNRTAFDFPRHKCVRQLFEEQAERSPRATAIGFQNKTLSYQELSQRSNALARKLQALGVGPGTRVGVRMKRSVELPEVLLAVLKAGAAYVPIHPDFPAERVAFIVEDAEIKVLVTNTPENVSEDLKTELFFIQEDEVFSNEHAAKLPLNSSPEDLAYIMYTSGSTGKPKGVMVHHSPLTNFLWSMKREPGLASEDVLLAVTSLSFDIAALELFLPLITGAKVVIASEEETTNPYLMGEALREHQVSVMQATPATWQLLLESGWEGRPGLKALCGGDSLTRKLADQLLERVGSLWNMYGPTETTIWSSVWPVPKGDAPITIGHPIANTQLYILDKQLQPLPIGIIGELHIGGEGLARGYLNRPELTAEKFIPDPFDPKTGKRLYKTGDRARYLSDHSIQLLGRMDSQVKINGQRIELGEVETIIRQHPEVQEAVVIVRKESSGVKRLVAYFVGKKESTPEGRELRGFILEKLPVYMVPAVFVPLDKLPLSPNGKIDRKALPLPEDIRPRPDFVAPRNREEEILASIWQEVLGLEQVGIHDDFFELGGASIQSLKIVAQANMSGLRLSVEAVFMYPSIAELVENL